MAERGVSGGVSRLPGGEEAEAELAEASPGSAGSGALMLIPLSAMGSTSVGAAR